MIAFIVMALVGTLFLLFGFIVWRFKIASVIAGYDKERVKDPDSLARWMGKCMMVTGLLAWVIGGLGLLFPSKNSDNWVFMAGMLLSMLSCVVALAGTQRYYK